MGNLRIVLTALAMLVLCTEEAQAQFSTDLCKEGHTTIIVIKLKTGFKEVFALSRDGSNITGRVQAWQVNGITAGRGNVTGLFGGNAPVGEGIALQIYWEGRNDIDFSYFNGYMHEGEAQGSASDLNRPFNPIDASATTLAGCAKWPEHDAAFCRDYAEKAVVAAKENVQLGCGNNGPRWVTENSPHLTWCLALGAVEEGPNNEAAARAAALQSCRAEIIRKRGQVVEKPRGLIGDIVKPVDPLDKLGVVKKPGAGIGAILKRTKP
jgi:hypothetical protein